MQVDPEKCIGSEAYIPYCTAGAILLEKKAGGDDSISVIDEDECVECGVCHR